MRGAKRNKSDLTTIRRDKVSSSDKEEEIVFCRKKRRAHRKAIDRESDRIDEANLIGADAPDAAPIADEARYRAKIRRGAERRGKLRLTAAASVAIGLMGFGGGSAIVPIIKSQTVARRGLVDEDTFNEQVVVANITPGAFPAKMVQGIGCRYAGVAGGLIGALLSTLPGALLTVVVVSLLAFMSRGFLTQLGYFSVGISVYIIYLMFDFVVKTVCDGKREGMMLQTLTIAAVAFGLTCGDKARGFLDAVFGLDTAHGLIVFNLSTIDLLILCFYIVCFTYGKRDKIRLPICAIVSVFFCFAAGQNGWLPAWCKMLCYGAMALCVAVGAAATIVAAKRNNPEHIPKKGTKIKFKPAAVTIVICIGATAIMCAICAAASPAHAADALRYYGKAAVSVMSTFGGGAAYYAIAEETFVHAGMIASDVFYSQLIPIVNAMPGTVMIKLLAAIGYEYGRALTGSMTLGYLYGATGFVIGVSLSAGLFAAVYGVYHAFSGSKLFVRIRQWVMPVICGLLATTALSLTIEIFRGGMSAGMPAWGVALTAAALFLSAWGVSRKWKRLSAIVLIVCGCVTLGLLNLTAWLT